MRILVRSRDPGPAPPNPQHLKEQAHKNSSPGHVTQVQRHQILNIFKEQSHENSSPGHVTQVQLHQILQHLKEQAHKNSSPGHVTQVQLHQILKHLKGQSHENSSPVTWSRNNSTKSSITRILLVRTHHPDIAQQNP